MRSVAFSGSNIFSGTYYGVNLSTDNGINWNEWNSEFRQAAAPETMYWHYSLLRVVIFLQEHTVNQYGDARSCKRELQLFQLKSRSNSVLSKTIPTHSIRLQRSHTNYEILVTQNFLCMTLWEGS